LREQVALEHVAGGSQAFGLGPEVLILVRDDLELVGELPIPTIEDGLIIVGHQRAVGPLKINLRARHSLCPSAL
jgi:hypothetical protein